MIPTISEEDYRYACEDYMGFCTKCGEFTHDSCEPDAEKYQCPVCDEYTVYGAELALIMGLFIIDFDNDDEDDF